MAHRKNTTNRGSNESSDHGSNQEISFQRSSNPQDPSIFGPRIEGPGIDATTRDLKLFGIDPIGSVLHKDAYEQIKVHLINTKFYFESAAMSIAKILEYMERVQRYDQEQKSIRDDELQRNKNQSRNIEKQ